MFKTIVLGFLVATFTLSNADAQTQRPPMADLLLKEPISLMDWGMMRAQRDIDETVERLNKALEEEGAADPRWRTMSEIEFSKEQEKSMKEYKKDHPDDPDFQSYRRTHYYYNYLHLRQFNYQYRFGYTGWSENKQRIVVGVAVKPFWRINPNSTEFRPHLIEEGLTADACTDLLHDVKAVLLSGVGINDPARLMQKWFGHYGPNPTDLDQIVAITNIEVNLSSSGGVTEGYGVPELACSQALNGGPATVHDHREKK